MIMIGTGTRTRTRTHVQTREIWPKSPQLLPAIQRPFPGAVKNKVRQVENGGDHHSHKTLVGAPSRTAGVAADSESLETPTGTHHCRVAFALPR